MQTSSVANGQVAQASRTIVNWMSLPPTGSAEDARP